MKKIIFLLIMVCISCYGCVSEYILSQSTEEIETIELYLYEDNCATEYLGEVEDITAFIDAFQKIYCNVPYAPPLENFEGEAIKIIYANGDYEIITEDCSAWYSAEYDDKNSSGYDPKIMKWKYQHFEKRSFVKLINKYRTDGR